MQPPGAAVLFGRLFSSRLELSLMESNLKLWSESLTWCPHSYVCVLACHGALVSEGTGPARSVSGARSFSLGETSLRAGTPSSPRPAPPRSASPRRLLRSARHRAVRCSPWLLSLRRVLRVHRVVTKAGLSSL